MNKDTINAEAEKKTVKQYCNQIIYIEASKQLSRVILVNNKTFDLLLSISEIEHLLLGQGFFKFNNKILVNLKYIQVVFPSNASKVIMDNGKEIFVDYDKREELFENLNQVYELCEFM